MVRKLLYLNGVAILGVILFHSAGTGFLAMFAWSHQYLPSTIPATSQVGSFSYYLLRFFEQIAVFAVPAFLFVSGYFVSVQAGRSGNIRWPAIFGRIRSLLIPYLIWSIVVIALHTLEDILKGAPLQLNRLPQMLLTGSTNEVLYFVPLLIQFYLLAPLFVWAARRNWKALLVIVTILQLLVQASQYPYFLGIETSWAQILNELIPKWFFLARIFWFPLGIITGFHADAVGRWLDQKKGWLLGLAIFLIPICILEWELMYRISGYDFLPHRETFLDSIYTLALIFGLLGLQIKKMPYFSQTSYLGAKSYGIYLTHAIFIEYFARIIYSVAPGLLGYQLILQPLLILIGLGGPLLLMLVVDKLPVRRAYGYLYG